jgi:hypothetical protein
VRRAWRKPPAHIPCRSLPSCAFRVSRRTLHHGFSGLLSSRRRSMRRSCQSTRNQWCPSSCRSETQRGVRHELRSRCLSAGDLLRRRRRDSADAGTIQALGDQSHVSVALCGPPRPCASHGERCRCIVLVPRCCFPALFMNASTRECSPPPSRRGNVLARRAVPAASAQFAVPSAIIARPACLPGAEHLN